MKTIFQVISKWIYLDHPENKSVKDALVNVKTLDEAFKLMENNFLLSKWLVEQIKKDVKSLEK